MPRNHDGGGMEGEMRLPLHPHRAQSRLKPGEPLRCAAFALLLLTLLLRVHTMAPGLPD